MNTKNKKHLIVIGHPDHKSFCYNGIFKTIINELENGGETYKILMSMKINYIETKKS